MLFWGFIVAFFPFSKLKRIIDIFQFDAFILTLSKYNVNFFAIVCYKARHTFS